MSSRNKTNAPGDDDALRADIRALTAADPAPPLGGVARASIIAAVAGNAPATSSQPRWLAPLTGRLVGGLDAMLRPVALGTLGLAGLAGLGAGSLMTAPAADWTPEQELAAHYDFARAGTSVYDDALSVPLNGPLSEDGS